LSRLRGRGDEGAALVDRAVIVPVVGWAASVFQIVPSALVCTT